MKIYGSLSQFQPTAQPVELAIGMFDGVHRGHQNVIREAVRQARAKNSLAVVLTFAPHPSRILTPDAPTQLIQSLDERCARIAALGVDAVIAQPFSAEFSRLSASEFIERLRETFPNGLSVHVGENFRFGRGGTGNFLLRETCEPPAANGNRAAESGLCANVQLGLEDLGERISSTRIRELLAAGEIARADVLLGWNYQSLANAIPGRALGRTIGFPTLNMPWVPELLPRFGVYAVRLRKVSVSAAASAATAILESQNADDWLHGVANYGLRPTVETAPVTPQLETHVFADAATLAAREIGTGAKLLVEWLHFIRPEQKFSDLRALLTQIRLDVRSAHQHFAQRADR